MQPAKTHAFGALHKGREAVIARILVTGGAGYIGAHAAKALAHAGHCPIVFDNFSRGHAYAVRWGPLVEADIADAAALDAAFEEHRPDAVMHFAASSEVGVSVRDPLSFWRNNVAGSLTLLERMVAHGVTRMVFSSTCAIHGIPERPGPLDETAPEAPINPYGETKLAVERMLRTGVAAHGLDVVALRYFNAAGASADGDIGEDHTPETHLIPLVLEAARDASRTLSVFGTDYPTPDGSCVRDYIHVEDLASAHVAALERILDGRLTGFSGIGLGAGRGLSVLEIIEAARRVTDCPIRAEMKDRREGDPPALVADNAAARRLLDWEPTRSDVDTILSTAWAWTLRDEPQTKARAGTRTA